MKARFLIPILALSLLTSCEISNETQDVSTAKPRTTNVTTTLSKSLTTAAPSTTAAPTGQVTTYYTSDPAVTTVAPVTTTIAPKVTTNAKVTTAPKVTTAAPKTTTTTARVTTAPKVTTAAPKTTTTTVRVTTAPKVTTAAPKTTTTTARVTTAPKITTVAPKPQEPITVMAAIDYSRMSTINEIMETAGGNTFLHTVRIPKLSGNSAAVTSFNSKLINNYGWFADELRNGNIGFSLKADKFEKGDRYLFNLGYDYSVSDNIVAIAETITISALPGGSSNSVGCYFFDGNNDREITFSEYINKMGIDSEKLNRETTKALQGRLLGNYTFTIGGLIIGDDCITVFFDREIEMGVYSVTLNCSLRSIMK